MKKTYLFFIIPIFLFIVFVIFSLDNSSKNLKSSFYHWKSVYDKKDVKEKLYIKVLDVSYSKKLEFVKTLFIKKPTKDFVPVVYITNESMKNIDAKIIAKKIVDELKIYNFLYDEIQIDCDWSLGSKYNYFKTLEYLKKSLGVKISATIRLHQIKYFAKTGVPPVDYGLLMYYNMSDITKYETRNSILDNDIAKKYHYNFEEYPLKLKLALPLYSQAIWFRKQKSLGIIDKLTNEDLKEGFENFEKNYFRVKKSFYFKGRYLYRGDVLRFENVKKEELKIALKDFFSLSKNSFDEVIFYSLEYKNRYDLEKILKGFR